MKKKTSRSNLFRWMSDGTLALFGFHHSHDAAKQLISTPIAVKSIILLNFVGIAAGFLLMLFATSFLHLPVPETFAYVFMGGCGILAAAMQAIRIARLNRETRRTRVDNLERKANKELAIS
jgi:hypothetical protein